MTKSNTATATTAKAITLPATFKSLADIGYQAARYIDHGSSFVAALIAADIGWPDNLSDDNAAQLRIGMFLRKAEITKPRWFRVEGKNLVELDAPPSAADQKNDKLHFLKVDVPYATGITPHQLGGMKESHPAEYAVLVEVRKAASKYASNVIQRLKAMTKAATMGETDRKRGATDTMKVKVEKFFTSLKKSNKVARDNRGDPTAWEDATLDRKVAAFWKAE